MKTILIFLLFTLQMQGQNKVTFQLLQDAKLATIGDDKGNNAFTTNVIIATEWQGNQFRSGYFFLRPETEYANLNSKFLRTSFNLGYRFNMFSDWFEVAYSVGYGIINRIEGYDKTSNDQLGFDVIADLELTKRLKLIIRGQFVNRTDLANPDLRYSNFIGLKYDL